MPDLDFQQLAALIKTWGGELGFQQLGIADIELGEHAARLKDWLAQGYHGDMDYMARHAELRARPDLLLPGTLRVISARLDYLPPDTRMLQVLGDGERAYISRYALGRDYHKLMRKRLQRLADRIREHVGQFGHRAFVDSAPVLERALAQKAGLGWIGKNCMLINKRAGSWFFLGELFTDLPLPVDEPASAHCGTCHACLDICPTDAFVGPNQLDARKCISYLTIESKSAIPEALRAKLGNRVFGCDDCQAICPWNKFAAFSREDDFRPRHDLDRARLVELFRWSEADFLRRTEGSAIRRAGYEGWLRNLAVGLGNAPTSREVIAALGERRQHPSALVREHVEWALRRHGVVSLRDSANGSGLPTSP